MTSITSPITDTTITRPGRGGRLGSAVAGFIQRRRATFAARSATVRSDRQTGWSRHDHPVERRGTSGSWYAQHRL